MFLLWRKKAGDLHGQWEYGVDIAGWAVAAAVLAAWWFWFS